MKNERENNKTRLLYETDGELTEFEAVVISVTEKEDRFAIELDQTAFFPEGGGQQADTGVLTADDGEMFRIFDVQTEDGMVCHFTDRRIPEGSHVTGSIDKKERFRRMQNHGAEHVISGIIHDRFGYENVGFHMTDDEVVFDYDGPLTEEDIRSVEERANEIVFEDHPFLISFPSPEEAEEMSYRSKLDTYENIRIVTIEGVDVCACCAPHVGSTGQIGVIKILSATPHRGGMRMTMVAGMSALDDYRMLCDSNKKIMELLSSKRTDTAEYVANLNDRFLSLKEENTVFKKEETKRVADEVLCHIGEKGGDLSPELIFTDRLDPVGLREVVNICTSAFAGIVCAFCNVDGQYRYIFGVRADEADKVDLTGFSKEFNAACNGKGGGSRIMVQGTCPADRKMIEAYFARKS